MIASVMVNSVNHNSALEKLLDGVVRLPWTTIAGPLVAAEDALARLDERIRGHSVGFSLNNARGEREGNIAQAAVEVAGKIRPLRAVVCAARSQRKSPEKAICSHPTGEV